MKNPVIILGTFFTCLSIARSLGRKGIKVYAYNTNNTDAGCFSRYIEFKGVFKSDISLFNELITFAKNLDGKPLIIPTSDSYLLFLIEYSEELKKYYNFFLPSDKKNDNYISKSGIDNVLIQNKIPHPSTVILENGLEDFSVLKTLNFPVIIKPEVQYVWIGNESYRAKYGWQKVQLIDNLQILNQTLKDVLPLGKIIIQEYIPGNCDQLFYLVGYRNHLNKMIVSFVSKKIRTYPDNLGSEVLSTSVANPELCSIAAKIFNAFNFHGVAGIDFKYDYRDKTYKVIEINFRFGLTDGLLMKCGIDLPYLVYCDLYNIPFRINDKYKENIFWSDFFGQFDWMRDYKKRFSFSWFSWICHILVKKHCWLAFSLDDPLPFFKTFTKRISNIIHTHTINRL